MDIWNIYITDIWHSLWTFGIYYGHLEYITDIWYILWTFGVYILWTFGVYILWTFGVYILWTFGVYILWTFGVYMLCTFCNLVAFWYIFPHFGLLCEEKSGNPDAISR
jgi:hypothetical protein